VFGGLPRLLAPGPRKARGDQQRAPPGHVCCCQMFNSGDHAHGKFPARVERTVDLRWATKAEICRTQARVPRRRKRKPKKPGPGQGVMPPRRHSELVVGVLPKESSCNIVRGPRFRNRKIALRWCPWLGAEGRFGQPPRLPPPPLILLSRTVHPNQLSGP